MAFDVDWFEENVVRRLLSYGANTLRFHLGMPPEALLDLCDRHGLLVQAEWSFFHGIRASHESLVAQWRDWFDLLMRHPSVAIIHPWNESGGDEVAKAFGALEEVTQGYPPQVLAHRDVIHVHKYWWSLLRTWACTTTRPPSSTAPSWWMSLAATTWTATATQVAIPRCAARCCASSVAGIPARNA